eukprot:scaffold8175_cov36-Phaeocystis_antarctica.AAC.1
MGTALGDSLGRADECREVAALGEARGSDGTDTLGDSLGETGPRPERRCFWRGRAGRVSPAFVGGRLISTGTVQSMSNASSGTAAGVGAGMGAGAGAGAESAGVEMREALSPSPPPSSDTVLPSFSPASTKRRGSSRCTCTKLAESAGSTAAAETPTSDVHDPSCTCGAHRARMPCACRARMPCTNHAHVHRIDAARGALHVYHCMCTSRAAPCAHCCPPGTSRLRRGWWASCS